jgi:hypothetical protein
MNHRAGTQVGLVAPCPKRAHLSVVRSLRVGRGAAALVVDGGTLWVARTQAGTVTRVVGSSRRVAHVGGSPVSLALSGGKLWVALRDADRIVAIDTQTLLQGPSANVPVPVRVVAGALGIWGLSLDTGALYSIAPVSGAVGSPVYAPVTDPVDMIAAEDELWVLGAAEGGLSPVNGRLGRIVRAGFDLPGRALSGLSASGHAIWLGEPTKRSLLNVDATTVAVRELPAPDRIEPTATAVGGCGVWVADATGDLVLADPHTAAPLTPTIHVGRSIAALTSSETGVWATDPVDGTLIHVDIRPAA